MRPLLLVLALFASGVPASVSADEETPPPRIYRWVDENGIAHYTSDPERIPKSLRRRYGLPAEPMKSERLDAHAPTAGPAAPPPAVAPSSEPDAWAAQEKGDAPAPRATTGASASADVAAGPVEAAAAGDRLSQIELRIAELSASIAADEDALSAWIGDPAAGDAIELGDKPEFREIAKRLPKRIQELEALQKERDALESAVR
jgi:hypothetical protein